MKAILIQTPCWVIDSPPYNLALLKAVCAREGHEIICLDYNIKFYKYVLKKREDIYSKPTNWYNHEYVKQIIKKHSALIDIWVDDIIKRSIKVIGFSTTGLSVEFSKEIARRIKEKDNRRIIIFGGPHCFRAEFGEVLLERESCVDAVCFLEGERVLPKFLGLIEKKGQIESIPGIAFRNEKNEIIDCFNEEIREDLNSLPFADYSDFKMQEYASAELPISTSRGCIYKCLFCSETGVWKNYRCRSAQNIFSEMMYQTRRYPFIKSFFFNDSLINGNIDMLNRLCDLLIEHNNFGTLAGIMNKIFKRLGISVRKGKNIYWGGQATIREEMTKKFMLKLRKADFSHVRYGLESGSERILKKMGKRFTPELAERVIRDTKDANIDTYVNIVIGFPTETEEDVKMTAYFLKRNKKFITEVNCHPLSIVPGSYLYEHRDDFEIQCDDVFNWYSGDKENTLEKRLETLKFYKEYIGDKGESFFTVGDYYLAIANNYFSDNDYNNALKYYVKAKEENKDTLKDELIREKIEKARSK